MFHRRSGRRLLLALPLVLGIFAAPAPALAAWPINGTCDHGTTGHFFGSHDVKEEAGVAKTAVFAGLYVDSARFQPCTGPLLDEVGASSQWVALEGTIPGSTRNILQVGMIKCNNENYGQYADSACTTARVGKLVYFYAFGWDYFPECNGGTHDPRPIYLGDATTIPNYWSFKTIWRQDLGRVQFWIGASKLADISDVNACWLLSTPYPPRATFAAERVDPNDGLGNDAGAPVHFDTTRYSTTTTGAPVWKTSNLTNCAGMTQMDPEFVCSWFSSDHFGLETLNR